MLRGTFHFPMTWKGVKVTKQRMWITSLSPKCMADLQKAFKYIHRNTMQRGGIIEQNWHCFPLLKALASEYSTEYKCCVGTATIMHQNTGQNAHKHTIHAHSILKFRPKVTLNTIQVDWHTVWKLLTEWSLEQINFHTNKRSYPKIEEIDNPVIPSKIWKSAFLKALYQHENS